MRRMRVIDWLREGQRRLGLRLEESHHPYNILSTNRAFAKHFTAIRARCHVTAFQQNAFNGCVHANFTQINRGQFIDGCNDKPRKRIRKLSIGKCVMWDILYLGNFEDHPTAVEHVRVIRFFHSIPWNRRDSAWAPPWVASLSIRPIPP